MGANESRSRTEGYYSERDSAPQQYRPNSSGYVLASTPQQSQQQRQQGSNAGAMQRQKPANSNNTPSAGSAQNRQTYQQAHSQNHRQNPTQKVHQDSRIIHQEASRQQPQQTLQQKRKPKKLAEVVQSLRQILEGCGGRDFTLGSIDALYHTSNGEGVPYSAFGFPSLSSMLEAKCDFLTPLAGIDGTTQWNLKPPSYQEAVNTSLLTTPTSEAPPKEHSLFNLVHDEISPGDFKRLKQMSETWAKTGITIQNFEAQYIAEFGCCIDFKGFSKIPFFNGLSDIIEVREDRSGIKLYSVTQPRNTPNGANRPPQNAGNQPQKGAAGTGQANTGNKTQPNTSTKTQPNYPQGRPHEAGGQKPQHAKNSKSPHKQQDQHQPRRQQHAQPQQAQYQGRSESRKRGTPNRLELSPYFEKELRKMMQQCKCPNGITPAEFRSYFKKNSSLEFSNHGLTDEEFFSALPHIFQMNKTRNGIRLMPTPLTTGLARNNFSNWQSTSVLEGSQSRPNRNKASASTGNLASNQTCTMHVLLGGRCLWIVSIENYEYVPTGCVAKLANMTKDTVLDNLRKHSLVIQYIRTLNDPSIKKILVDNHVAQADEVVQTIPLKSIPLILRAFLGKEVDEDFIANLQAVSVEHNRNKKLSRYNRQ